MGRLRSTFLPARCKLDRWIGGDRNGNPDVAAEVLRRAVGRPRVRTEAIKRLPYCVPKDTVDSKKRKKKKPLGDEPSG